MDDLRTAIAVIFKRKGSDRLTEAEIVNSAVFDLHWFNPASAKKMVELAVEIKLIRKEGGGYTPNFNYRTVEPTLDFSPGVEMLEREYPRESLFPRMLSEITSKYSLSRQEFMRHVNRIKDKTGTDIEIAALLYLSETEREFSNYIPEVEEEIMRRYSNRD